MSFDIFLIAFKGGETFAFDRSIVIDAFGSALKELRDGSWHVIDDDDQYFGGNLSFTEEGEGEDVKVTGFGINRPPFCQGTLKALLDVMRRTPSMLYWPGEGVWACVAHPDVFAELPAGMFASPDELQIVSSPADIARLAGCLSNEEIAERGISESSGW